MKVYINRKPIHGPWGGGAQFINSYHDLTKQSPGIELLDNNHHDIRPDVMLLVGLESERNDIGIDQAIMYKMYVNPNCKLILRVNENDARKGTNNIDNALLAIAPHVDGTVFVSKWLQEHFNRLGWACKNQIVIVNGVDQTVFAPKPKLNNGKLNIVAHHWSNNPLKGADIYEQIDELVGRYPGSGMAFTYIGRHQCNFKHTRVIRPLSGKALGDELGKHDVYVSGSRFDPGPNHVIESISCGLPTYVHKDGGGCVEFAGQDHAYDRWDELESVLLEGKLTANQTSFYPWDVCIKQYNDFIKSVWAV